MEKGGRSGGLLHDFKAKPPRNIASLRVREIRRPLSKWSVPESVLDWTLQLWIIYGVVVVLLHWRHLRSRPSGFPCGLIAGVELRTIPFAVGVCTVQMNDLPMINAIPAFTPLLYNIMNPDAPMLRPDKRGLKRKEKNNIKRSNNVPRSYAAVPCRAKGELVPVGAIWPFW